jgi:hypothetical protein
MRGCDRLVARSVRKLQVLGEGVGSFTPEKLKQTVDRVGLMVITNGHRQPGLMGNHSITPTLLLKGDSDSAGHGI